MSQQASVPERAAPTLAEMKTNAAEAARLMRALSNENRLLILCYLQGREMSVGELNRSLELSQSALSQHLAVLREQGLVQTRRESQTIFYRLEDSAAMSIIELLHDFYCRT